GRARGGAQRARRPRGKWPAAGRDRRRRAAPLRGDRSAGPGRRARGAGRARDAGPTAGPGLRRRRDRKSGRERDAALRVRHGRGRPPHQARAIRARLDSGDGLPRPRRGARDACPGHGCVTLRRFCLRDGGGSRPRPPVGRARAERGVRVIEGVESATVSDGTLDYGPDVLDRFDFVIGSIHSRFGMSEDEMTRRVLTAMDDPHLAILGHPTGRLLFQREPYAIDLEQVLAKAAARGIAVEVNADPHRLDLDWRMVRRARELGVTCSIGADAHSTSGMANVAVGLGIARKGWLEPDQVLNTRDAEAFLVFARARLVAAG